MDVDAASIMSSCTVHDEACLNTSDHLPISVKLDIPTDSIESPNASMRIDWTKADLSGATLVEPERSALVQSIRCCM